jgi:hypothetical protein
MCMLTYHVQYTGEFTVHGATASQTEPHTELISSVSVRLAVFGDMGTAEADGSVDEGHTVRTSILQ